MSEAEAIVRALGGDWRGSYGLAPCPICQAEGRRDQRGLSVRNSGGRTLLNCHKSGCGAPDLFAELRSRGIVRGHGEAVTRPAGEVKRERKEREAQRQRTQRYCDEIFASAVPITNTPAETYLVGRGIVVQGSKLKRTLRFHPGLKHSGTGEHLPAMIARIRGPQGQAMGLHRTYLQADGSGKADLPGGAKLMLAGRSTCWRTARASLRKFERQLAKAQADTNTTTKAMQKNFDQAGTRIAQSAAKGSAGIMRLAQMSGRTRFVFQNTANQLGDIAVQMQGGTSAARVFGQQMPQLLGALGGALGVVAPLLGTVAAIGIPVGAALFAMGRDSEAAAAMLEKIDALDLGGARSAISSLTELQNRYTEALRVAAATRSESAIAAVEAIRMEYEAEKGLMALRLVETENQLRA